MGELFGFDAGEGLREHQASRIAIVQVVKVELNEQAAESRR